MTACTSCTSWSIAYCGPSPLPARPRRFSAYTRCRADSAANTGRQRAAVAVDPCTSSSAGPALPWTSTCSAVPSADTTVSASAMLLALDGPRSFLNPLQAIDGLDQRGGGA
ncbi:hypothetical protein G6F68_019073 [Rhizopus microsporus]|nr:hypothetical protein G6F68_019073 [Rhizopus microsporus]